MIKKQSLLPIWPNKYQMYECSLTEIGRRLYLILTYYKETQNIHTLLSQIETKNLFLVYLVKKILESDLS